MSNSGIAQIIALVIVAAAVGGIARLMVRLRAPEEPAFPVLEQAPRRRRRRPFRTRFSRALVSLWIAWLGVLAVYFFDDYERYADEIFLLAITPIPAALILIGLFRWTMNGEQRRAT